MKKLNYYLTGILFLLFHFAVFAQTPKWNQTNITTSRCGTEIKSDIAFDNLGNTYVIGATANQAAFNSGCLNQNDLAIYKINSAGTISASVEYDYKQDSTSDIAYRIKLDGNNNVFVTGSKGNITYLLKFNSALVLQWTRTYFDFQVVNIFVSGNNIILAGNTPDGAVLFKNLKSSGALLDYAVYLDITMKDIQCSGNTIAYCGQSASATAGSQFITVAYDTSFAFRWAKNYNSSTSGTLTDYGVGIGIANGNIYALGLGNSLSGGNDMVVMKYNSTGSRLWTKKLLGPGTADDLPIDIKVEDINENVYITGNSNSGILSAKYNASGALQWSGTFKISSHYYDKTSGIVLDGNPTTPASRVYIGGNQAKGNMNGSGAYPMVLGLNTSNGNLAFVDTNMFIATNFLNNGSITVSKIKYNSSGPNHELVAVGGGYPSSNFIDDKSSLIQCYNNLPLLAPINQLKSPVRNIQENEENISLWPNPSANEITIESSFEKYTILVFDMVGNLVLKVNSEEPSTVINIRHLPKGAYIVKLTSDEGSENSRFIKN